MTDDGKIVRFPVGAASEVGPTDAPPDIRDVSEALRRLLLGVLPLASMVLRTGIDAAAKERLLEQLKIMTTQASSMYVILSEQLDEMGSLTDAIRAPLAEFECNQGPLATPSLDVNRSPER